MHRRPSRIVVVVMTLAVASCSAAVENGSATKKCAAAETGQDCKSCCVRNGASAYLFTGSTAEGGACSCRGFRIGVR